MRLAAISFTEQGGRLNRFLCAALRRRGHGADSFEKRKKASRLSEKLPEPGGAGWETGKERAVLEPEAEEAFLSPVTESLGEWTGRAFGSYDGLIFVGACGIAVRAIAPFVKDKFTDPAVVVVDERASFAVALLSGHVGGANDLCRLVAELCGAVPVISTATDVNGLFAVDVFAEKNGLVVMDRRLAKEISAAVLAGGRIPFFSSLPMAGDVPEELHVFTDAAAFLREPGPKAAVSERLLSPESGDILYLVPRTVTAGMGCRRGTGEEKLRSALERALRKERIFPQALAGIATIEDKKGEEGLTALAERLGVPFRWYQREELLQVPGEFSRSDFVMKTVGVDCVCERAAVLASGGGKLLFPKRSGDGITVAAAIGEKKLI